MTRHRLPARKGFTLIELSIAMSVSFVIVMALGKTMTSTAEALRSMHSQVTLQQEMGLALHRLSLAVRSADGLVVIDDETFAVTDAGGNVTRTFALGETGGVPRLQADGSDLNEFACAEFVCEANDDTTAVTLTLEFTDGLGNRSTGLTVAAVRNANLGF
jgi:prepilin-type N-terminal cleavage/methylation domain-containing protein